MCLASDREQLGERGLARLEPAAKEAEEIAARCMEILGRVPPKDSGRSIAGVSIRSGSGSRSELQHRARGRSLGLGQPLEVVGQNMLRIQLRQPRLAGGLLGRWAQDSTWLDPEQALGSLDRPRLRIQEPDRPDDYGGSRKTSPEGFRWELAGDRTPG
ncbi:MAG: hypothetical protein H6691_01610 [Gemmatimonadales bacterium]|nr:hypothetical protein [Gemmatimonadales bacterium]